jgi:hypothetical protein
LDCLLKQEEDENSLKVRPDKLSFPPNGIVYRNIIPINNQVIVDG